MKYVRAPSLSAAKKKVAGIVKKRNTWHVKKESVGTVKIANKKVTVNGQHSYRFTTRGRK